MRSHIISAIVLLVILTSSTDALEIRGSVASGLDYTYIYTPQNFAGFYYDIDNDLGPDSLSITLNEGNTLVGYEPYGIIYETDTITLPGAAKGMKYGNLTVISIDRAAGVVVMANKDHTIVLARNKKFELIPGIFLRTADNDTLRYYIYKEINTPGSYEIRSSVAVDSRTWTPQDFAGFYYDIKKDLGTETIQTTITDGNMLREPDGVIYQTTAQQKTFRFPDWGCYNIIGFNGKGYFAGYALDTSSEEYSQLPWRMSIDENSLASEQLEEILIDDNSRKIVKKGESIKLDEGYELVLQGVSEQGRVYLELRKNGTVVDESFIAPSVDGATMFDKTYYYRRDVGSQSGLVTVAVYFIGTYKDEDLAAAKIGGIWQISDTPISVASGTQFGRMRVSSIDGWYSSIAMDNKGNTIALDRDQNIELMPNLYIRTADNETFRYYLYRMETI